MSVWKDRATFVGWLAVWFSSMMVLIALLVIAYGCNPKPPVVHPVPPPPPTMRTVQATVRNAIGPVAATLLTDDNEVVNCGVIPLSDGVPRIVCVLNPLTPHVFGAHLTVTSPDRIEYRLNFALTGSANQDVGEIVLRASFVPLSPLVVAGRSLRQSDGTHWTAIEASDFNLYNRFLNGEDIEPVLSQRSDTGFSLLRVWTGYNVPGIGRLVPKEHPDFYARIPEFLQQTAKHRLYVEFTAFTGPYVGIFDSDEEKVQHWERLKTVTCGQSGVAYLELVNEYDNPPNVGLPFDRLTAPTCPGLLASHGSAVQDAMPKQPFWSVVTYRPASGETQRKAGHNAGELTGFGSPPVLSNETQRFPDNDNDPNHAYDMAAGCVLLSAGCAFHSVHGKDSTLWQGDELRDAQAFAAGAKSVPLNCQDGGYQNLGDQPGYLRVYRTGGLDACTVSIRP